MIDVIGEKIYLTEAGKTLAKTYQTIAAELNQTKIKFEELKGCIAGKLSLSGVSTSKYFIPHLLGKFKQHNPKIDIALNITNRQLLIERLRENVDDMVIMSQLPEKLPIVATPIVHDELVIVASANHKLATKKRLHFNDLKHEPFLSREQGSGTRMVMEKLFAKHKLSPATIMELGSSEAIKQAVMANIGLSLLSKMSIEQ